MSSIFERREGQMLMRVGLCESVRRWGWVIAGATRWVKKTEVVRGSSRQAGRQATSNCFDCTSLMWAVSGSHVPDPEEGQTQAGCLHAGGGQHRAWCPCANVPKPTQNNSAWRAAAASQHASNDPCDARQTDGHGMCALTHSLLMRLVALPKLILWPRISISY